MHTHSNCVSLHISNNGPLIHVCRYVLQQGNSHEFTMKLKIKHDNIDYKFYIFLTVEFQCYTRNANF